MDRRWATLTSAPACPRSVRLLLASLAYTLIEAIRRIGLKATALAQAYVGTIRLMKSWRMRYPKGSFLPWHRLVRDGPTQCKLTAARWNP